MSAYSVTVRTPGQVFHYPAIAETSADAINDAIDVFGVASVTATPLREVNHG